MLVLAVPFSLVMSHASSQELYVFSEPASNMPARALSVKYTGKFLEGIASGALEHRQKLYAQFGLDRRLMLRAGATVSSMYSYPKTRGESMNAYLKYRFVSRDDVHAHFRAAAFLEGSRSRNDMKYDELSLEGDHSGLQGGLVLTQLVHKLAVSATVGVLEVFHWRRRDPQHSGMHSFQSLNYSLSAGYLLFPRKYTGYGQTNLNIYLELLGSRSLDKSKGFLDLAPALQLILNSNTKVNLGYRFQASGNMFRMAERSVLLSVETTFLNAFGRKGK